MATELALVQTRLAEALKKLEPKAVKPARKAAAPKDQNAEKKPLTSYMLFCDRTRKAAPIGTTYSPKQLGELWKALSTEQKAEYKA